MWECSNKLSVVREQAFLSSFKKYSAQWKVRVSETDSDYVI